VGEGKLVYGKNSKWLCSIQNELWKFWSVKQGGINMKKVIVTVACTLIALLAFGQPRSNDTGATTQPITVTGTIIPSATEEGAAASYQPAKTLVVREDQSNTPGRYVLNGRGHVVNKLGEVIQTAIKPGTRVRVYYANMGDLRMIDHVVILD
jgi:hypothetical protein